MALNNSYAVQFNRIGSIVIDNLPVDTSNGAKTTVEFWMKWDGIQTVMPFGWNTTHDLYFQGGYFGFNNGQSNMYGVPSAEFVNKWVHVAAVFENSAIFGDRKLYINGIQVETPLRFGEGWSRQSNVTSRAFISGWGSNTSYKFGGMVDEVRIWNYERTSEQVARFWNKKIPCGAEGLIGYWGFDEGEGSIVKDCTQYGNDGVIGSGLLWRGGEVDLYLPIEINIDSPVIVPRQGGNLPLEIVKYIEKIENIIYKVEIVSPMYRVLQDWVEYDGEKVCIGLPIDLFGDFNERKLRITIIADQYEPAIEEVTAYLVNTAPLIEIVHEDYDLTVRIRDDENDPFNYKVTLNDRTIFPYDKEIGYSDKPVTLYRKLDNNDLIFGEGNVVKVVAMDKYGLQTEETLIIKGDYYGLLFTDENRDYYSTNLGEILKRLQVAPLVAGEVTGAHKVLLINNQSGKVKDLRLQLDYYDEVPHTLLKFSKTEQPFIPQDELKWEEVEAQEELEFYVRLFTTKNAYGKGKFKIMARAMPMDEGGR